MLPLNDYFNIHSECGTTLHKGSTSYTRPANSQSFDGGGFRRMQSVGVSGMISENVLQFLSKKGSSFEPPPPEDWMYTGGS